MLFDNRRLGFKAVPIFLVHFFLIAHANAENAESIRLEKEGVGGQIIVEMDAKMQTASGIKIVPVSAVDHRVEFEVIGKVLSVEPLLALRERYFIVQAELDGAKARLKQAGRSLKRQQDLFENGVTAKRSLQELETQTITDQALVDASQVRLTAIANEARLRWGKTLADMALADNKKRLDALLSGNKALLQIFLPTNKPFDSKKIATIFVEPNGDRSHAFPAVLVAPSPQADSALPGKSYFFKTDAGNLQVGMKISAWIPGASFDKSGVVVPASALLWYMDQVYVYIKTDEAAFSRRLIKAFSATADGYFIPEDIKAGEEVVSTGAQMLLSEELRGQIPDED